MEADVAGNRFPPAANVAQLPRPATGARVGGGDAMTMLYDVPPVISVPIFTYHIIPYHTYCHTIIYYHTRTSDSEPHQQNHFRRVSRSSVGDGSIAGSHREVIYKAPKLKTGNGTGGSLARMTLSHCKTMY